MQPIIEPFIFCKLHCKFFQRRVKMPRASRPPRSGWLAVLHLHCHCQITS